MLKDYGKNLVITAIHLEFSLIIHRTSLQKSRLLSLNVFANNLAFHVFVLMTFSFLSGLSAHVGIGRLLWITTSSVQASLHGILLLWWGWYTHFPWNPLEPPERYEGWTSLLFKHLCRSLFKKLNRVPSGVLIFYWEDGTHFVPTWQRL